MPFVELVPTGSEINTHKWGRSAMLAYDALVFDTHKGKQRLTEYRVHSGWNDNDSVALDIAVSRGNPIMTRNTASTRARMDNAIAAGFPTDHISVSNRPLPLMTMALHELAITHQLSEEHGRRTDAMMVQGESRRAMISLAMARLSDFYAIDTLDLGAEAPCFAKLETLNSLWYRTARFFGREVMTAVGMLARDPHKTLANGKMLLPPREERGHYIQDIPSLLSGKAGRAASQLPRDISGQIVLFKNDWWSQPSDWLQIFDEQIDGEPKYPNLQTDLRKGSHASLGEYSQVRKHRDRMYELADRYRNRELPRQQPDTV